jgi:Phosphotransferase enzyme family
VPIRAHDEAAPSWAVAPAIRAAATVTLPQAERERLGLRSARLGLRRAWPRESGHVLLEYIADGGGVVAGQWFDDRDKCDGVATETAVHGPVACAAADARGPAVLLQPAGADRGLHTLARLVSRPGTALLAHRAERRAVLQMGTGHKRHYARVVPPGRVAATVETWRVAKGLLNGALGTPDPVEVDEPSGVILTPALPGVPLNALLGSGEGLEHARAVGRALGALHAAPPGPQLTPHGPREEARVLEEWIDAVARHAPRLEGLVREAARESLDRLEDVPLGHLTPAHRDFHDGQVLIDREGVSVVDFDTLCLAEPALDLANILVHLELRALQRLCGATWAEAAGAALLEGYGARPDERLRLYADATRLRLACVYAFRPRWGAVVPALIRRVGRTLGGFKDVAAACG